MVAFLYRMPAGIPGAITRSEIATVEPGVLDTSAYPTSYGVAVAIDGSSHKVRSITTGDTASSVYGVYVRPYPTSSGQDGLGTSTPPVKGMCDILKRGYISILLNGTTPAAKGGAVYIRVATASSGKPIGGFEAASDDTNTILVAGAYFTGPADANGITELAFNI